MSILRSETTYEGMSVYPVLIHVNGVQESVMDSLYFTEIIDFGLALTA